MLFSLNSREADLSLDRLCALNTFRALKSHPIGAMVTLNLTIKQDLPSRRLMGILKSCHNT